jgi:hypothetical protein
MCFSLIILYLNHPKRSSKKSGDRSGRKTQFGGIHFPLRQFFAKKKPLIPEAYFIYGGPDR